MASFVGAFMPGQTQSISVTTSTAATALTGAADSVMLSNTGSATAYFAFGSSAVTATLTTSTPVFSNTKEVYSIPPGATHIATIGAAATTLMVTNGAGL